MRAKRQSDSITTTSGLSICCSAGCATTAVWRPAHLQNLPGDTQRAKTLDRTIRAAIRLTASQSLFRACCSVTLCRHPASHLA